MRTIRTKLRVEIELDSLVFEKNARGQKGTAFVSRQARDFKTLTKQRQIAGPHTGAVVSRGSGDGFRLRHQQSARGERPAPDTFTLVNSIEDQPATIVRGFARGTSFPTAFEVFIQERINPRNGAPSSYYGERLQVALGREIMTEADALEAERKMELEAGAFLRELL